MDNNTLLIGILVGVFSFATGILIWQLSITFAEVRETLRTFRELSKQLQGDLTPTLQDLNEMTDRLNLTLESLDTTRRRWQRSIKQAKRTAIDVLHTSKDYLAVLSVGVSKGLQVLMAGGSRGRSQRTQRQASSSEPAEITPPPGLREERVTIIG